MKNQEIIKKLKEDLNTLGFTVRIVEYYLVTETDSVMSQYNRGNIITCKYLQGIALIKDAIEEGLYLDPDKEFTNIL
jgi:hypothetical protein